MLFIIVLTTFVLSLVLAAWVDRQVHKTLVQLREREALKVYVRNN